MINAEVVYKMIQKHPNVPLDSMPLLIAEETPIPVPYDDIPLIIQQLENEGKVRIFLKDEEKYCEAISNV